MARADTPGGSSSAFVSSGVGRRDLISSSTEHRCRSCSYTRISRVPDHPGKQRVAHPGCDSGRCFDGTSHARSRARDRERQPADGCERAGAPNTSAKRPEYLIKDSRDAGPDANSSTGGWADQSDCDTGRGHGKDQECGPTRPTRTGWRPGLLALAILDNHRGSFLDANGQDI